MKDQFTELRRELLADGWEFVTKKRHVKLQHPVLGVAILPASTSDWRAIKNKRSQLARAYADAGMTAPWKRAL